MFKMINGKLFKVIKLKDRSNAKMENKKIIVGAIILSWIFVILFVGVTSAETSYIFKQNTSADLNIPCYDVTGKLCNSAVTCTISINRPDGYSIINNALMDYNPAYFNYTVPAEDNAWIGSYAATMSCNDSNLGGFSTFSYEITLSGNQSGGTGMVVLFSILFIGILLGITYVIITSVGHAMKLDFDIRDLAWNYGLFFAFLGIYALHNYYVGNPTIESFFGWGIWIGATTLLFLPTIYFILTLTVGSWMAKRVVGVDM